VLRITAVSAGAVDYLIRGSGCTDHDHAADHGHGVVVDHVGASAEASHGSGRVRDVAEYMGAAVRSGEAPGRWLGSGLAMLGIDTSGPADEETVRAVFGRLEHPVSGELLGRPPRMFKTYQQRLKAAIEREPLPTSERLRELELVAKTDGRKAVAYYDFTFSPVKSVSVYYAALLAEGFVAEAELVVAAHRDAVEAAMAYAETHIAYTRVGYHGRAEGGRSVGRYEAADGLIMTAWDHSTNREKEPQLHTHVAVLNRAVTSSDGRVRALDGRGFRPIKEAVATIYERGLEQGLRESLGVEFATRPDGLAREILGVDPELCVEASTRRAQVLDRLGELVAEYEQRHGRSPDAAARKALSQAATLGTRAAKAGQAGPAAVLAWARQRGRAMTATVNGVAAAVDAVAADGHPDAARWPPAGGRSAVSAAAVADVQSRYATWTVGNLIAAIDRHLGDLDIAAPDRATLLDGLAGQVLAGDNRFGVRQLTAGDPVAVPEVLRRSSDGRSVFRPHLDERYATADQLAAEVRVVAAARAVTAPAISGHEAKRVSVELMAAGLAPDQVAAVVGIMGSGRAGDVLIGPAGTGKSRTVAALARVWEARFGGRVLGLATSQRAADVLTDDGVEAINTSVFLHRFTPDEHGVLRERIGRGDLFVVDEASMSSTRELNRIAELVRCGGGKLVFTGDHRQLGAVGAGGLLELLVVDNGAFELEEIHRFTAGWEGPASARLRAGDVSVLPEYEDRARLVGGTVEEMHAAAVRGYLADTVSGLESVLIVGTNAEAARLSTAIREQLIACGRVDATTLGSLRDGCAVSAGDLVQARRNDRSTPVQGVGAGRALVTNRQTYRVVGGSHGGGLVVVDGDGAIAHLPAGYVEVHLTLAYASTVHATQGRTVDTAHAVLGEQAHREDAYVALTRGRDRNTAYLTTTRAPDAHDQERLTSTPVGRLAAILDRTGSTRSAELERRLGDRDRISLGSVAGLWDEVSKGCAHDRDTATLATLLPAETMARLVAEPGFGRLLRAVRAAELAGHDPAAVLEEAIRPTEHAATHAAEDGSGGGRGFRDADSITDVLRMRVRLATRDRAPERHVDPADWTTWTAPVDGPVGDYLHDLAVLAGDRQTAIGHTAAQERPLWATSHLGTPPDDPESRERWVPAAGIAGAYRELRGLGDDMVSLGAVPSPEQELHRALWEHAATALGQSADVDDPRAVSEGELREQVACWERAQSWAPAYVAPQLRAAHAEDDERRRDAVLGSLRLTTALASRAPERAALAADLAVARQAAAAAAARARELKQVYAERGTWSQASEDLWRQARAATEELTRRGLSLDPTAQGPEPGDPFARDREERPSAGAAVSARSGPGTAEDLEQAHQRLQEAARQWRAADLEHTLRRAAARAQTGRGRDGVIEIDGVAYEDPERGEWRRRQWGAEHSAGTDRSASIDEGLSADF
jgi:conjugative relaxase-like TrwC/TraI family protein